VKSTERLAESPTDTFPAVTFPGSPEEATRGNALPAGRWRRLWEALRTATDSYRVRIVSWFVALLALGSLATVLVVGQLMFARVDEGIRTALAREVEEFRTLASGNDPATGRPFGNDAGRMFDAYFERHIAGNNEIVVGFVDGRLHATSAAPRYPLHLDAGFVAAAATAPDVRDGRLETPVGAVDYVAVPVIVDGNQLGVFAAAGFRDLALADQNDIVLGALVVGMILVVLGSLLAWRLADRLLAPVARTAATAHAISETDLSQRIEVRGYDELAYLARTLNEMLDRLEAAFVGQRRFLDDVGHELRTPLTIVRGHLELLDEGSPAERRATVALVLDELDRMTRLVNELIVLAQAGRPDFLHRQAVDAGQLVVQAHEKVAVLGQRDWRVDTAAAARVECDPQRLTQALVQLAANAVAQTAEGATIELGVEVRDGTARFWVADDGPGVAAGEQERIFERFYRGGGQTRAGGTGLGLSIVRAIAEAHGGRAQVRSAAGRGARFEIVIPVARP
jgi:two-component system, OmpR family, sensor kinase